MNTQVDMKEIQNKILEITIYLDEFCEKHNIEYFLMGGSALGAARHKGFIPWDDDLDVFMTYNNYQKFINCATAYLDKKRFYLQKENTNEWPLFFTKLRMNNTTFIEEDTKEREMHKGFYVDIMCLNNVPSNKFLQRIQYLSAKILVTKTLKERGYITNSFYKKRLLAGIDFLVGSSVKKILLKNVRKYNEFECENVGHFFGRARFKNCIYPQKYIGELKRVEFSGELLPVMQYNEDYLEIRYGKNYMDMPDEATKAMYPSHAIFIDTQNDYKKYE